MSEYWMLEVRTPKGQRRAVIGKQPNLRDLSSTVFLDWLSGNRFPIEIPEPLQFQLDPDGGNFLTDFFPPAIPLMSVNMLDALTLAGVDNIDSYEAILLDRSGSPIQEEYRAINIIGSVACADLENSDCEVDHFDDPVGVDFNSLVIDETRTNNLLFFRLHEAPNGIVIHDSVRSQLEPLNLSGIQFLKPEDWIG